MNLFVNKFHQIFYCSNTFSNIINIDYFFQKKGSYFAVNYSTISHDKNKSFYFSANSKKKISKIDFPSD